MTSSIVTGARIVAAGLQGGAPQAVIKLVDQSQANSAALVNDNDLIAAIDVSSTYLFACYLNYEGAVSGGTGGLDYKWVVPAGATLRFSSIGITFIAGNQTATTQKENTTYSLGSPSGPGVLMAATMLGTLITSTTAGTLQLQWEQAVSTSTPTIVHAQSYLALWQIT